MISIKLKIQTGKKSLLKLTSIILVFLLSYSISLAKVYSQSDDTSNNTQYAFLIFFIVVIVLTILTLIKNPVSDSLLKHYKVMIIALIVLFLLIYFIPQIPIKSITGLFVVQPTTTTTTTTITQEVQEETLPGLIHTFSEMQPGRINSMQVSQTGVSLTELNLEVSKKLENVRIVVSKLPGKPISTMEDPPGYSYQYLEIEKTNIKDEDIKKVTIKFKVEKSWIVDNEIDDSTVSLYRYQNNIWFRLSTKKTSEDDQFVYYETGTASLSLFAISGSSQSQEITTTTTIVTTTTTTVLGGTSTSTQNIVFDRSLECNKCGQHKAPPLTDVTMTITATVSKSVKDTYLADYYPVDWTITNLNGGQISSFNSSYNKIQWVITSVDNSVTRWYVIKSPQRTLPPTNYYFFSEMDNQKSSSWQIKVADPTEELEQPYDCNDANVNCNETIVAVSYPDGSKMMVNYQKPVNYFNDSLNKWQAINSTLGSSSCTINYNYCVVKGIYEAHFKTDPTLAEVVRYFYNSSRKNAKPHKTGYVLYQPFSLNYRNDLDQIQQINITKAVTGIPMNNEFLYPNIFGSGYNLSFTYIGNILKEKLTLKSNSILPAPQQYILDGGNPTLDLDFLIDYSDTVDMYVDGQAWDKKTTKTTSNRVDFKDTTTGEVLFYLPKPYAKDLNETNVSTQSVTYQFKKTGSKYYVVLKTPYAWLINSSRVYPITIDPSTKFDYNTTVDYYSINNTLNGYYFNATNAEQKINDIQNYWAKNDVCLDLYLSNAWHEFCGDSLDWVWYNSTNFNTYMNLTGTTTVEYGSYSADIIMEYYLESNRNDITITPTIKNTGMGIPDSYLKIHTHDIRINNTYENDSLRVVLNVSADEDLFQKYDLSNTSLDLVFDQTNLTSRSSYLLDFPDSNLTNYPDKFGRVIWNESKWVNGIRSDMDYRLEVKHDAEYNVPVNLILELGNLNKNDTVTTKLYWIDDASKRYNKTLSRLYEKPWKIVQFFDSNLSKPVEMYFDKYVYTKGEDYTLCVNSSTVNEKTVNAIYYGWLKKVDEPTGIKGYFSGMRKVNNSVHYSECWHGKMNLTHEPDTTWKMISPITPGKYVVEGYYHVYESNEQYFTESELIEII